MLEALEDRLTPSAASATAPLDSTPSSSLPLLQPLLSLSLDGAYLESENLIYSFVDNIDEFPLGSTVDAARTKAAAAGVNFDTVMSTIEFLGHFRDHFSALSDIHDNLPTAGVFAPFALRTGVEAVLQAVQLPVQPHTGEHVGDHD